MEHPLLVSKNFPLGRIPVADKMFPDKVYILCGTLFFLPCPPSELISLPWPPLPLPIAPFLPLTPSQNPITSLSPPPTFPSSSLSPLQIFDPFTSIPPPAPPQSSTNLPSPLPPPIPKIRTIFYLGFRPKILEPRIRSTIATSRRRRGQGSDPRSRLCGI